MITSRNLVKLLEEILPHLILKKEQAKLLIDFRKSVFPVGSKNKPLSLSLYHELLSLEMKYIKGYIR